MRGPFALYFYCSGLAEIPCQLYFVWFVGFEQDWGLTRFGECQIANWSQVLGTLSEVVYSETMVG